MRDMAMTDSPFRPAIPGRPSRPAGPGGPSIPGGPTSPRAPGRLLEGEKVNPYTYEPKAIAGDANDPAQADLSKSLDAMGPVNVEAIQEYDELEERYKFLEQQFTDLTNSKTELLDVIAKINTTCTTSAIFANMPRIMLKTSTQPVKNRHPDRSRLRKRIFSFMAV